MTERAGATINIGGRLPGNLFPEFVRLLRSEGLLTYGGPYGGDDDNPAVVELLHDLGTPVSFYEPRAYNGKFEDLEDWLVEHGIGFTRVTDAYDGFPSRIVHFRPGMKGPVSFVSDGNCPVADLYSIDQAIKEAGGSFDALVTRLHKLLGKDLPPLEPFQVEKPVDFSELPGGFVEVEFISRWDSSITITTPAKLSTRAGIVFDIKQADTDGLEVLEAEYIVLPDGSVKPVTYDEEAGVYLIYAR